MAQHDRHIILLIDNFAGHNISYQPKNIRVEFFAPNLTSYVQPCDAGIIRCFKAHYHHAFCLRALDADEAGQENIYKIDLLEAMLMAKAAWSKVTAATIEHCWNHTKIQPSLTPSPMNTQPIHQFPAPSLPSQPVMPQWDPIAWIIIRDFAITDMSMPQAENKLQLHLGIHYKYDDWRAAYSAVLNAEGDISEAIVSLDKLTMQLFGCPIFDLHADTPAVAPTITTAPAIRTTATIPPRPDQLEDIEKELMDCVDMLAKQRIIRGQPLTLEEMLNPEQEREIGESSYKFEGDDEIVAQVKNEIAIEKGEIEVDSDGSDEEGEQNGLTAAETVRMCEQLEQACLHYGDPDTSLALTNGLRKLRIHIKHELMQGLKQKTLDDWAKPKRWA